MRLSESDLYSEFRNNVIKKAMTNVITKQQ